MNINRNEEASVNFEFGSFKTSGNIKGSTLGLAILVAGISSIVYGVVTCLTMRITNK